MDVATLASVLSGIVAVLAAIVAATVFILSRFSRLERRVDNLEVSTRVIGGLVRDLLALVGGMIQVLHAKQVLSEDEYRGMFDTYIQMASGSVDAELDRLSAEANPLTREEADKLRYYIAKARRTEFFTVQEVEDYNRIVHRIEAERPNDPGVWPLLAIGAFLFGLFLARRKREDEETGG